MSTPQELRDRYERIPQILLRELCNLLLDLEADCPGYAIVSTTPSLVRNDGKLCYARKTDLTVVEGTAPLGMTRLHDELVLVIDGLESGRYRDYETCLLETWALVVRENLCATYADFQEARAAAEHLLRSFKR